MYSCVCSYVATSFTETVSLHRNSNSPLMTYGYQSIVLQVSLLVLPPPASYVLLLTACLLHNEELHNLYSSPDIIRQVKSRTASVV
jgi:hypothetical protein